MDDPKMDGIKPDDSRTAAENQDVPWQLVRFRILVKKETQHKCAQVLTCGCSQHL